MASLPAGQTQVKFFYSALRDGNGSYVGTPPDASGRFRLSFTGAASSVTFTGATNVTQIDSNTWEFDTDMIGAKWVTFTPTSFPIKVAIVRTTDLAAHAGGGIFRQQFLDSLPSGGCFRFMDWAGTNNSPVVNIADYPVASAQNWTRIPLSVMTNLCNTKSADMWICIPHQATDAFVTEWATYLRDNLNTARKIRVELSNEIWNTSAFTQAAYFKSQAETVWGVPDGYADGVWLHYAGKRFAQIMQIFNSVFVGQTNRLIGVIAAQAAQTFTGSAMADAARWAQYEPGSYVAPHTLAKEMSIAPYINWAGIGATGHGNAIKTQLDISQAAAVSYINGMTPASLTQAKGWIDGFVGIAGQRNLRLTMYEYNQHYSLTECSGSTLYSGGFPVAGALDAFMAATYSQDMADAQDELRAYFKAQNGSLMCFYIDCGRASTSGTWGARTHFAQNSPIWNTFKTWCDNNPRNWNPG